MMLKCQALCNDSPILADFKHVTFMGIGKPDFGEGQSEKRAKPWKMPDFPGI